MRELSAFILSLGMKCDIFHAGAEEAPDQNAHAHRIRMRTRTVLAET